MVRSGGEIFAPTRSASSVNGSFWSVVVQIGETISGPTPPSFSIGRPQTSRFGNRSLDAPGTRDRTVSSVPSVWRIVGSTVRASWATPAGTGADHISRLPNRPKADERLVGKDGDRQRRRRGATKYVKQHE